jgi:hypothetical protein
LTGSLTQLSKEVRIKRVFNAATRSGFNLNRRLR